jgi:MoaA/NifB/PqqE/SkfB family radical SAM enzyme
MYKSKDIKKVHLEITQLCQAACPMCDRNENGGKDNKHITNSELSLDDCMKIFSPEFIKQLDTMYMCGNLGDPIVASDTLEVFRYFREHNSNMWLSMNTNAGARDSAWWTELAKIYDNKGAVIFSVDGLIDTNHLYRQNVKWSNVENSMRSFINAGGRARWDFIIFEHNQHQVEEAEQLANEWGCEKFIKKKTARFFSTARNEGKEIHQAQNRKGTETILLRKPKEEFQNRILSKEQELITQHGSMTKYYDNCNIDCKVANEGNIFITAEGLLMPCCWTAGRMYKWWHEDYRTEQIWDFIDNAGGKEAIDVINNDLIDVLDNNRLFSDIESSWSLPNVTSGKLSVCSQKCGIGFDAFSEQFK